jgi:pimeloyl-ACP methyl ester carboxylesterase
MPDIGGAEKPACFSYPPPSVEIVWFEESGHMIPMESPAAFQRAIIEKVLPTTR